MSKEAGALRRGNAIRLGGELLVVVELQHVKPGKGPAYLQAKLKTIPHGHVREHRFRISESVDSVFTERKKATFSYRAGDDVVFMYEDTFEEVHLPATSVGPEIAFFAEGDSLELELADGDVIGVGWPDYVTRTIVSTPAGVKAAQVTNQIKPATLDNGAEIGVPIFLKEDEKIRINVQTGKYHERVKD